MHNIRDLTGVEAFDYIRQIGGAWVVYRPVGGIGDAVMLLPTINGLRRQIGDDLLVVSCVDYIKPVFEMNPNIDYIFEYDGDDISKGNDLSDLDTLGEYGSIVYSYYHPCPAAIYESKYNPYRIDEKNRTRYMDRDITLSRQQIFCDHASVECDTDDYQFNVSENGNNWMHDTGLAGRYIVVQLRSHDPWRDYPRMNWLLMELVRLGQKRHFRVVTIDATQTSNVEGVISYTQLNLYQVFTIIKNSLMLIGPDSMGVHVKGALGGHLLGLFGPTNPKVRLKYRYAHFMDRYEKCNRQYCWYTPCKFRFCLNGGVMKPKSILRRVESILEEAEL